MGKTETLGARLTRLMRLRGVKINDLARKVALSGQGMRDILSGKSRSPKGDIIVRLSREFGVSTDWLLTGKGDDPLDYAVARDGAAGYAKAQLRSTTPVPVINRQQKPAFIQALGDTSKLSDLAQLTLPEQWVQAENCIAIEMTEDVGDCVKSGSLAICVSETGEMKYVPSGKLYALLFAGHLHVGVVNNKVEADGKLELVTGPQTKPLAIPLKEIKRAWQVVQWLQWA